MATLDGLMSMNEYYVFADDGRAIDVKEQKVDLTKQVPTCPTCRGSLRNVNRYGCIVRQGLLAESTKRFINWSNRHYIPLAQEVGTLQEKLVASTTDAAKVFADSPEKSLDIQWSASSALQILQGLPNFDRYRALISVYKRIVKYGKAVAKEEQPFRRVWDLVQHKRRAEGTKSNKYSFDNSVLQTRQHMLALSLMLRCELIVLSDFIGLATNIISASSKIDFTANRQIAAEIAVLAEEGSQPAIQTEAYVHHARFCLAEHVALKHIADRALASGLLHDSRLRERSASLKDEGFAMLKNTERICRAHRGSTSHLVKEIEQVDGMLKQSTLGDILLPHEMKAVYEAMAQEFRGTGHWYYCANGHLFTIGECGMPMQVARCPQCGARIGGEGHRAVAGVQRAQDLEMQMENLNLGRS